MTILQVASLLLVAVIGTGVVMTRDLFRQILLSGVFGCSLIIAFVMLQAPDVALSAVGVSAFAGPVILLFALVLVEKQAKLGRYRANDEAYPKSDVAAGESGEVDG